MRTNWIYQRDCLKGMRELMEPGTVNVVVTSPPYNIGAQYRSYDDNRDFETYCRWLADVMAECKRVLSEDGSIFLNLSSRPSEPFKVFQALSAVLEHLVLQNTIHWIKSIAAPEFGLNVGHYKPVNSKRFVHGAHEYIFHLTKRGDVELDMLGNGCEYADKSNIGRYANQDRRPRGNTWYIPYDTVQSAKLHPATFPVLLPTWCILLHGLSRTRLVLDPFMGTGTTAVAARRLGVSYVGFETEPEYVRLARARLRQTPMPAPLPAEPS